MKKQVLPIILCISLAACTNANTTTSKNEPATSSESEEHVADKKQDETTQVEETAAEENKVENKEEKSTEEEASEEKEASETETEETSKKAPSRKEEIAAIRAAADEKYEHIKKEKALFSVDGAEAEIEFDKFTADEIINSLGLDLVSSELSENEYFIHNYYKTKADNDLNVTTVEEGSYLLVFNNDDAEITLPYGITNKDTPDEAREKLGDMSLKTDIYVGEEEGNYDYVYFATKNVGYALNYEKDKLVSIDMSYQEEDTIKQNTMIELTDEITEDKSGVLTIEGKDFTFPIKYQDLADLLGAELVEANDENVKEFIPVDQTAEEAGGYYYLENKVILQTDKGSYLVEYFTGSYGAPIDPIYADDNISSITFSKDSANYSFANNEFSGDREKIDNIKNILDENGAWYDDLYGTRFYLDDFHQVSLYGDQVIFMSTRQKDRNVDELGLMVAD